MNAQISRKRGRALEKGKRLADASASRESVNRCGGQNTKISLKWTDSAARTPLRSGPGLDMYEQPVADIDHEPRMRYVV